MTHHSHVGDLIPIQIGHGHGDGLILREKGLQPGERGVSVAEEDDDRAPSVGGHDILVPVRVQVGGREPFRKARPAHDLPGSERAVAVPGKKGQRAVLRIRRDEVGLPVLVEVRGRDADGKRADGVLHRSCEGAVTSAEKHGHATGDMNGCCQVEPAVPIEVGDGEAHGVRTGSVIGARPQRAVSISEKDRHEWVRIALAADRQVREPVPVQVRGRETVGVGGCRIRDPNEAGYGRERARRVEDQNAERGREKGGCPKQARRRRGFHGRFLRGGLRSRRGKVA
jgi:hypothetical protein